MTIQIGEKHYYEYLECIQTLENKPKEEQLKVIYMWIKQKHIGLTMFKHLIEYVEGE